ncbi:hypothetical protein [Deinococcus koreensis]|uniref:Uncharacterized protein n=1 Tax=Deinococcus koreensis TaxID=2054903 RepID=A0A2K3UXY7_9DEIO|nr:hypothetical protein [Deinococcus koreensis]PNY81401.1 hypothetical protein CVO96_08400 [Deinococcus koreensis]
MHVLNIPAPPALLGRWRSWLAPPRQPFFLTRAEADALALDTLARADARLTPEERDTFTAWNVSAQADRVAWLTLDEWDALPPPRQRTLLHAQLRHGRGNLPLRRQYAGLLPAPVPARFLWRPEWLTPAVLARLVSDGRPACRRADVPEPIWQAAAPTLPGARELAGTFPAGSGPNCFGTVMAAAGVVGAEREWMQREPFEAFLRERTRPAGQDDRPGTLLVWRSVDGLAQHAAITLGGGWALHKPSQGWMTPRVVLDVPTLKRSCRTPGWHLTRRTLLAGAATCRSS